MTKNQNKQRILDALPGTQKALAAKLGLGLSTVCRWLTILVDEKNAHISKWEWSEGYLNIQATYSAGCKPKGFSAHKPKTRKPIGRTHRYRARLRASGDWEDVKAKQRAYYYANRKPKPDPLMTALFGTKP